MRLLLNERVVPEQCASRENESTATWRTAAGLTWAQNCGRKRGALGGTHLLLVGCHTRNLRSALKATLGAGLAATGLTATADFIIAAISVSCEEV
jgi:hypothetical protein